MKKKKEIERKGFFCCHGNELCCENGRCKKIDASNHYTYAMKSKRKISGYAFAVRSKACCRCRHRNIYDFFFLRAQFTRSRHAITLISIDHLAGDYTPLTLRTNAHALSINEWLLVLFFFFFLQYYLWLAKSLPALVTASEQWNERSVATSSFREFSPVSTASVSLQQFRMSVPCPSVTCKHNHKFSNCPGDCPRRVNTASHDVRVEIEEDRGRAKRRNTVRRDLIVA